MQSPLVIGQALQRQRGKASKNYNEEQGNPSPPARHFGAPGYESSSSSSSASSWESAWDHPIFHPQGVLGRAKASAIADARASAEFKASVEARSSVVVRLSAGARSSEDAKNVADAVAKSHS